MANLTFDKYHNEVIFLLPTYYNPNILKKKSFVKERRRIWVVRHENTFN